MKNITLFASIAATSFLIVGCGGGSSTTTSVTTNAKITGTVPGTLIEVFCDNGFIGQVTSTQNGTNQHPFEIDVPVGTNCKLVMTTNENDPANRVITPIAFSNGSTIVLNGDVDLGNIPLEISYQNADDKDGDHVMDNPLTISSNGAETNNNAVQDADGNGMVDSYDDDNDNNIPNAYEDNDNDGIPNLHDNDYRNGNDQNGNDQNGNDQNGNDQNGNDQNGNDQNGNDQNGNDQNGNDQNGNDQNGNDQNGNDQNGNDQNGNDQNGNDQNGNDNRNTNNSTN